MTVDGKITTRNFGPVDFTSREDKLHLFRQRALADAVIIGHSTLKRDNVRLRLPAVGDRIAASVFGVAGLFGSRRPSCTGVRAGR